MAKQSEKYYEKILSIRKILEEKREEKERKKKEFELEEERKREEFEREEERKDKIMQAQIDAIKNPTTNSISTQSLRRPAAICLDDLRLTPFDGTSCKYRQFETLFEEVYEKNKNYSEAQLFLIFQNLIGDKGREIISTLKPNAAGLKTAKQRMRAHFQDPNRVRESIQNNLKRLPTVNHPSKTENLRVILTALEEAIEALEDCGTNEQLINYIFLQIVLPKIPRSIKSSYKNIYSEWIAKEFANFLYEQIKHEMSLNETEYRNYEKSSTPETNIRVTNTTPTTSSSIVVNSSNFAQGQRQQQCCKICDQNHSTIKCNFQDAKTRKNIASMKKLCFRCLRPNHRLVDCTSRYVCRCGGTHSSVICFRNNSNSQIAAITTTSNSSYSEQSQHQQTPIEKSSSMNDNSENEPIQINLLQMENSQIGKSEIENSQTENLKIENSQNCSTDRLYKQKEYRSYLPTFLVRIGDVVTRVLFDTGAERSIVSEQLATKLNLPIISHHHIPINGFEATPSCVSKQTVQADLQSIENNNRLNTSLIVVPNMPEIKCRAFTDDEQQILNVHGYEIPDIIYDRNRTIPIEIILGQDYCWDIGIITTTRIHKTLHMIHTRFGCMLSGIIIKGEPIDNLRKID